MRRKGDLMYNGWKNIETSTVWNWLTVDDDGEYCREMATKFRARNLARAIREHTSTNLSISSATGLARNMMDHALDRVNWDSIAKEFTPPKEGPEPFGGTMQNFPSEQIPKR